MRDVSSGIVVTTDRVAGRTAWVLSTTLEKPRKSSDTSIRVEFRSGNETVDFPIRVAGAAISLRVALFLGVCLALGGCGTLHSLSGPMRSAPCIYSGIRLDWAAMRGDAHYIHRYSLIAPDYPGVDLPLSFAADSLFLPLSLVRASYQAIFVPDDL